MFANKVFFLVSHLSASLILLAIGCKTVKTYPKSEEPIMLDNAISELTDSLQETQSLISFNVEKSRHVDAAIKELNTADGFSNPTILLLQEMNQKAVVNFSHHFKMNYIYYPIGTNKDDESDFGNAILAKHKIYEPSKLILPHAKIDGRIRNATNAIIEIAEKKILIYSIHNETILLPRKKRQDQLNTILKDIQGKEKSVDAIIVGGDFNTLLAKDLIHVTDRFSESGFIWSTENIGATSSAFMNMVKPQNDHIFTKNVKVIGCQKLSSSKSSDHLPVKIDFTIN